MDETKIIAVDARGLRCPLPVLRLRKAAVDKPVGTRLDLVADDPAALVDVPAFVREQGWTIEDQRQDGTLLHWRVRVGRKLT